MKLKFCLHVPPPEILWKTCENCLNCDIEYIKSYNDGAGTTEEIIHICGITHKRVDLMEDHKICTTYEAAHWETLRVNDYRRLE